jgi:RNA-binding protein
MAALSIHERKRLRQIGHVLNPVVMIGGQGLTDAVIEETLRALNDHELIKVKLLVKIVKLVPQ